ncbi:MAG: site-2 protease family protein [Thermostichus sp. BF3_bins_97]
MTSRLRIGSLWGIPFFIDYTWFPVALLLLLSYGVLTALGLFFSSLAHELAHSLVARAYGVRVNSITLFIFGGMAAIEREVPNPLGAFWVAAAGPLLNLGLFVLFSVALAWAAPESMLAATLTSLAAINLALGLFNLLPGLPLDGGQILKAAIWGWTGDRQRGMMWAARAGQFVGFGLLGLGLLVVFTGSLDGLWLGLIGLFILNNARRYSQYAQLQQVLGRLKAGEVMTRHFRVLDAGMSLREFVDRYVVPSSLKTETEGTTHPEAEVYFAEEDGRYRGLVRPELLNDIERSQWDHLTLKAILKPMEQLQGVREETPIPQVIQMMRQSEPRRVLVLTPTGAIAGLIDRGDVVAVAARRLGVMLPQEVVQRIRDSQEWPPGFQAEESLASEGSPSLSLQGSPDLHKET